MKNNKTLYIVITIVLLLIVASVIAYKQSHKEDALNNQPEDTNTSLADDGNSSDAGTGSGTGSGTGAISNSAYIHAGSIRLLSPLDNGGLVAGAKITAEYELTAPVTYGTISLIPNTCTKVIENGIPGKYTFTCDVPVYIGREPVLIQEMKYKKDTAPKATNDFGSIRIIAPANVTPKSIVHYPEGKVLIPYPGTSDTRGYVELRVLYSDNVLRKVSAAEFKYSFGDPTIAAMSNFFQDSFAYINGKKEGTTNITATYGAISTTIPIQVIKR